MTLTSAEFSRLQYLLGKQQVHHVLSAHEQGEVSTLLRRENPAMAAADWESLLSYGFILVGARLLYERLRSLG